jgi:hypothetical protein
MNADSGKVSMINHNYKKYTKITLLQRPSTFVSFNYKY